MPTHVGLELRVSLVVDFVALANVTKNWNRKYDSDKPISGSIKFNMD